MSAEGKPSPDLIFDTITAYQKTAAMKAAVDVDLFTQLVDGPLTAAQVAKRCGANEFLLSDELRDAFASLGEAVRRGGTARPNKGSTAPEHPMWITFARAM